jgi:molybdopterin biosynthesis enzyme MoaB
MGLVVALPALASANPITDENALPGSSGWERTQADTPAIQGYTDKTSVAPGGTIGFRVSTSPAVSYRIIIYRLGWYGGTGARQIACLPACSGTGSANTLAGAARSTPPPNAQTGEIDASNNGAASWPQSTSWTVPANATSGEYVAEYIPASGSQNGLARYSPFVVRSAAPQASASNILVVVPYNTYNAYNLWGGTSAYDNTTSQSGPFPPNSNDHATKVSFNRPFYRREWRFWDLPLLRFLEREGYDVSYVSDTDVDANPGILQQHRAVIVSGHSEYWTKTMRNGFDAARNAGTNLMFAGANDAYWQVRYEDSSCPDDNTVCSTVGDQRTMVIYKGPDEGPNDPMPGTADDTSRFRDLGRPECVLMGGVQYGSYFTNDGYRDYTTTPAGASDPWAAGTGLSSGSTVKGLVGFEYDSFDPTCHPPGTPTILFQYAGPETSAAVDAAAVRYTDPTSGARVFSSGTEQWAWGLDAYRWDSTMFTGIPPTQAPVQQFTRNMLADMRRPSPPAGVTATPSGDSVVINTTPRSDPRVSSYKIYRHAGTGAFQPGDSGVILVCQNASGDCTDTPPAGTFRYAATAVDQWSESSAVLSSAVTINPVTAVDDSATVNEDAAAAAVEVLANDTPSGTSKTITARTQAGKGNVVITGGGTGLTYQPNADYCGSDSFTYTINGSSTATVSVAVNCVDDPPVAVNDSATVAEDAGATAISVLGNDTDVDAGPKTVSSVTQPSHGTVVRNGDGSGLTYQPSPNYCGPDSFTYALNGGDSAIVSVTVSCVDDPPVAVNDTATVDEDASATSIAVLSNDTDSDGGPKTIASRTLPANGDVVITEGGTGLTYRPDPNYCGPDSFTYALNGGDIATVSVTVTCVDDRPVALPDAAAVSGNSGATSLGVLANDTDIDGGPKAIASASPPAHGAVVVAPGGTGLTYQPAPGYCGTDGFNYTLNGGSSAAVTVTVDCSSPPIAAADQATVPQAAGPTPIDVLANDPDPDGGPKSVASATQPGGGVVLIVPAGSGLTYQPNPGYCNSLPGMSLDSFTYTLNGGSIGNVLVTVTCPAGGVDAGTAVKPQPKAKKCKTGFRKVKGKCKKKRKRRK